MESDRQRLGDKPGFSQMFVSRSRQLCRYVKDAVGEKNQSTFITFDKLVIQIESSLTQFTNHSYHRSHHVGFSRFRNEFYTTWYPQEEINALMVWKAIRTFLKGSIEAFQQPNNILSREYFVGEQLGKSRCKVPLHLRDSIYDIFLQYQQWISEHHLFDDCDRISALLKDIKVAKESNLPVYDEEIKKARIYVE